jgi:hypothetical protein
VGAEESTWRATATPQQEEENIEYLHEVLKQQLKSIQAHASAWPFLKPVSRKEAPHYHEIIKDPIGTATHDTRTTHTRHTHDTHDTRTHT